jgi:hypothetical protein
VRLLDHKIIHVQSDWGCEYRNMNTFFQKLGVSHRVTVLLNISIVISLRLASHYLLMHLFLFGYGVMLLPSPVFLLIGSLHVF